MPRYTLIVFDRGVGYPEEMPIIKDLLTDEACCAAQCGPINISQFSSDCSKEEISSKLKENEIEFILTEVENLESNLPKSLHAHFSNALKIINGKLVGSQQKSSITKVSLEEQLKAAEKKEDYEAAAKIRDEIKRRNEKQDQTISEDGIEKIRKKVVKKSAPKKAAKKSKTPIKKSPLKKKK